MFGDELSWRTRLDVRMLRVAVFLLLVLFAPPAFACGGFMAPRVASGQTSAPDLRSDGSKVALVRNGIHTIVSLSMRYRGPPDDFALVVPVPVVLPQQNVRTLHPGTFERLDAITRPELVEQWEEDPCREEYAPQSAAYGEGGTGARAKGEEGSSGVATVSAVKVEAAFSVNEYDIVILGASDSVALERWLKDAGYAMPPGIEPFLRPYVAAGSKFFVAKVDARKIELSWGRAVLSPIRFEYDSETFSLPIRLGLANVDGDQDLTLYVMGHGTRYEAANYENALIPTNVRLVEGAKERFPAFYEKLFTDTLAQHPKSFVTEYAMALDSCAGCDAMFSDLGAESEVVLTRLHTRYGAAFASDLVLRTAMPLEGGNEAYGSGDLPNKAGHEALENRFRGRYFVRHPWRDTVDCSDPRYGSWSGTDTGSTPTPSVAATAPLDQWMFHGDDARSHARPSLVERLDHVFPVYHGTFVVLPLVALLIALGVLVWRARRLGVPWWRPAAVMVLVSMAPALALVSRASWHTVTQMSFPIVEAVLYVVVASVVVAFAMARSAGRRVASGLEVAVALAPVLVALVTFRLMLDRIEGFAFAFGDGQAPRVFAEAEGEATEGLIPGACAAMLLLGISAWSFRSPAEDEGSGSKLGAGRFVIAIAIGIVANLLVYVGARDADWPRWAVALAFVFGIALTWRLETSKPNALGDRALALGATWLVAMLLLGLACIAKTRAMALQAVSGESIDPTQRGRILHAMDASTLALGWQAPLAALASVIAPIWLALRNGVALHNARRAAPAALVLVVCVALWSSGRSVIAGLYASQAPRTDERANVEGVEPATVALDDRLRMDHVLDGPSFLATRAGALLASPNVTTLPRPFDDALWTRMASDTLHDPNDPLLVADRGLTVGKLDAALAPVLARRHTSFRWVLGQRRAAGHGMYGLLEAGPDDRGAVALEWRRTIAIEPSRPNDTEAALVPEAIAVRLQADALETVTLSGVHGRYRRFQSATVQRVPRADPADSSGFPSMDPGNMRVVEVVLCVTADLDVSTLTALIRSFMVVPPRAGWGLQAPPAWLTMHPLLHFVVTTDASAFTP